MQPKVSVIIPIFNVERYLSQCLDSVVNQTLKEIEIICVNDGSTDKSLDIIKEYASKDSRIVIIDKKNSGYGHSMNCGMDIAKGEYIGIIESDDYAELQMFEKLYNLANKKNLDVVKSGFFYYWTKPEIKNEAAIIASKSMSNRIFCPLTDFKSSMEQVEFFNIKPTILQLIIFVLMKLQVPHIKMKVLILRFGLLQKEYNCYKIVLFIIDKITRHPLLILQEKYFVYVMNMKKWKGFLKNVQY